MTGRIRLGFSLIVLCGLTSRMCADSPDARPDRLLPEALTLAVGLPDGTGYGNWAKSLAVLRIAATMRLQGMTAEAAAGFEQCAAMNSRVSDAATRDEMLIELCREFTLLGQTARARRLAQTIVFRNYQAVASCVIASTAWEIGHRAEAETVLTETLAAGTIAPSKTPSADGPSMRALVRLAVRIGRADLARRLSANIQDAFWKSASLVDLAVLLAQQGKAEDALQAAERIPDSSMAVMAYARLAVVWKQKKDSHASGRAMEGLDRAAAKLRDADARDWALRFASGRVAAADVETADRIAAGIQSPAMRVLAGAVLIRPASVGRVLDELGRCPEQDRGLLAEAVAVACGAKGMGASALEAASRVSPGWPRFRTLGEAARRCQDACPGSEAARLLCAAAATLDRIDDPGWRASAEIRLALLEYRLGHGSAVDQHLEAAANAAKRVATPEHRQASRLQVVEAAAFIGRREFVSRTVQGMLKEEPDAATYARLVPMLIIAGCHEAALAECSRKDLADPSARRLVVYRLAVAGQLAAAVKVAGKLRPSERAEALADIALAQIARPAVKETKTKMVGVSLHGSWGSWLPRLERMGLDWQWMPFSAPYEEGPAGLTAKYCMLGYPGTGGHESHVAVAGAEHLRQYLYSGGGFLGICAGQYLATGRQFVPCSTIHMCGQGPHQVQIRKNHPIAVNLPPVVIIARMNGGFVIPHPGCEVIGWYDTVERYAALVAGHYGLGRVVVFSPHPEGSSGLDPCDRLCITATLWAIEGLP